ncbi:PorP/SprF family type IX secretion system membrane protein [Sporocytophaga myxococcoides]|uniref:PorP/SprF family type IX secretion system membrane protein n=1 Tax=Sporocytophaga myxococcoides TaxID=153721 RepID=UPI000569EC93|nr:type IX secretion system membrane protein PorP/SprF [Sporocytophaga myxococcoides]
MKQLILNIILILCLTKVSAQDLQYSQFYANALYLSPSFAGSEGNSRGILASRYQWPGLEAAYFTTTASVDHYFHEYRSGVALIATSDLSMASKLKSKAAGIIYCYQMNLNKKIVFRPSIQFSYVTRSIDFDKLTFGSQYNDDGFQGGATRETLNSATISYATIAAGGLIYTEDYWIGITGNNLNTPNQSFMDGKSSLPAKVSFFGGYKFRKGSLLQNINADPNEEKSLTPTFLYKMQGKSDQLDIGLYGRYNILIAGFWYRGIPVKLYKPERSNNDALVFLVGLARNGFKIGYSYDYTISRLALYSGGSHELTLSIGQKKAKKTKIRKKLPCPSF